LKAKPNFRLFLIISWFIYKISGRLKADQTGQHAFHSVAYRLRVKKAISNMMISLVAKTQQ